MSSWSLLRILQFSRHLPFLPQTIGVPRGSSGILGRNSQAFAACFVQVMRCYFFALLNSPQKLMLCEENEQLLEVMRRRSNLRVSCSFHRNRSRIPVKNLQNTVHSWSRARCQAHFKLLLCMFVSFLCLMIAFFGLYTNVSILFQE